jgi:two-component system response regulator NreC
MTMQSLPVVRENAKPTLFHIEDDPIWVDVVAKILREDAGLTYLGSAATAIEGLEAICSQTPDIVLLDLILPDADGFDVIGYLQRLEVAPRILFLTVRRDEATLFRLREPCVMGMIWKNTFIRDRLPLAISQVIAGRRFFSADLRDAMNSMHSNPNSFYKILSNRELELLPLLGRGHSDAEIAGLAGIKPLTVKSHRDHILSKLGLHKTRDLMRWCAEKGFTSHHKGLHFAR